MAYETEKTCLLIPRESRASCVFHAADEKDEIPGIGEDRWESLFTVIYLNVCVLLQLYYLPKCKIMS